MEQSEESPVNSEVFRILKEKVSAENQDNFLRAVIAHIKGVSNPTRQTVVNFFNEIWVGAVAHDKRFREALGKDYE